MNMVERIRESISYNPATGVCLWKERPRSHFKTEGYQSGWNKRFSGRPVGSILRTNGKCYLQATLDYKHFLVHRVIWVLVTGENPVEVDHQDGDGLNNKWGNLRNTDGFGNHKNMRKNPTKELPTGVCLNRGKYMVSIRSNNKRMFFGRFNDLDEAVQVRNSAYLKNGFHENHGTVRPL